MSATKKKYSEIEWPEPDLTIKEIPQATKSLFKNRGVSFTDIQFIGWDGEGINQGFIDEWTECQKYVLISASSGEYIYRDEGISFEERLTFVTQLGVKYPRHTHVIFGASYDFNKLIEGLPREKVEELHTSKNWVQFNQWYFRYRPRKELVIAHLPEGKEFDKHRRLRDQCDGYIRFWDVIGFFQMPFLKVVEEWLGIDYIDYELLATGKEGRLHFTAEDKDFIIQYNAAEVKALVKVMEILHAQLYKLDLRITRWDGAGAIAAQVFKKYNLTDAYYAPDAEGNKKTRIELPEELEEATRFAYFGGRIESGFIGSYYDKIWSYDINSAYPFAASLLPDLNQGKWKYHEGPLELKHVLKMNRMTLFRVQFHFENDRLYYPFPYRCSYGAVLFPKDGERWIYAPELWAAINTLETGDILNVWEAWEFRPFSNAGDGPINLYRQVPTPFSILGHLYYERLKLVKIKDPAEKVLKLAINAVYGKICQKIGWNESTGEPPRFHLLLFAGAITSFTRAMIYNVVYSNQDSIVSISTDGILATKPIDNIRLTAEKEFGGWSTDIYDSLVQLQSGVYWLLKNGIWKEKARGLGRVTGAGKTQKERENNRNELIKLRIQSIENGWKNKKQRVYFDVKSFITSKQACRSDNWFPRLGHWYRMHDEKTGEIGRGIDLLISGWGKRRLTKPVKPGRLTRTIASVNVEYGGELGSSIPYLGEPYALPWLSKDEEFFAEDDEDLEAIF